MATIRKLREQRERASDGITYASWTAIGTASLGGLILLTSILKDWGNLSEAGALLSGLVGQVILGLIFGWVSRASARSTFAAEMRFVRRQHTSRGERSVAFTDL